jgi:hypothetical protein
VAGWADDWIDAAEEIVRIEFKRKYAVAVDSNDDDDDGLRAMPSKKKVRFISLTNSASVLNDVLLDTEYLRQLAVTCSTKD